MSVSIIQATMELRERDLPNMVLVEDDLAPPFDGFSTVREGDLDNRNPRRTRLQRRHRDPLPRRRQNRGLRQGIRIPHRPPGHGRSRPHRRLSCPHLRHPRQRKPLDARHIPERLLRERWRGAGKRSENDRGGRTGPPGLLRRRCGPEDSTRQFRPDHILHRHRLPRRQNPRRHLCGDRRRPSPAWRKPPRSASPWRNSS